MSVSFNCHCEERKKPAQERDWVVVVRKGNNSAFNGYRWESSLWSLVWCNKCGALGRTKGIYVDQLKDGEIDHSKRVSDAHRSSAHHDYHPGMA